MADCRICALNTKCPGFEDCPEMALKSDMHCQFMHVAMHNDGKSHKTVLALDSFAMDEIRRGLELLAREKMGSTTDTKRITLLGEFNAAMGQSETEYRRLNARPENEE